jgi:hypothetical protein
VDEILELVENQMVRGGKELEKAASSLPTGLKELYEQMLDEHSVRSGVSRELQLLILQWVTHAPRSLRLLELASLINFTRATGASLKDDKETVRASCGRLLEVLPDETISIIHHSFTEFLRDDSRRNTGGFPIVIGSEVHVAMALICLQYIQIQGRPPFEEFQKSSEKLRPGCPPSERDLAVEKQMNIENPLMDYSMSYWHYHIKKGGLSDKTLY